MDQQFRVMSVEGDHAVVRGQRASTCGDCAGKASCATMGSWRERVIELRIPNTAHAHIGDIVLLEVPDRALLRTAFHLYGLPMLVFIMAGLAMRTLAIHLAWSSIEAVAMLAGVVAVLCYYLGYRRYLQRSGEKARLDVHMVHILEHAGA